MRFATIILALTLSACSNESVPPTVTAPTPPAAPAPTPVPPPAAPVGFLAGMVMMNSGACIKGASIEIIAGQGVGRTFTQTAACSWWDWEEGFLFTDLVPDAQVTIRASAPGFGAREATFTPSLARNSSGSYLAVMELPDR